MSSNELEISHPPPPVRRRNRRGEGFRLRDDIIAAATSILERTGSEDAITLRAVAREIGIAAPSIDAHFADRAAIIDAVVAKELGTLHEVLLAACGAPDPGERLLAICRAYVDYGQTYPARYRILVGRRFVDDWEAQNRIMEVTAPLMAATIGLVTETIQECIDAGASGGADAYTDTMILWFSLHGLILVRQDITSLPWPDGDQLLVTCVARSVQLTSPPSTSRGRRRR